jgi:hypothetical protein
MRIAACVLVLLCAAAAGLAQEAMVWSLERRLKREDFSGRVPASASTASMSWIHIETEWECKDGTLTAMARATFDPSRSWFRRSQNPMELDIQLLEHEQIHFDIAEVAVRKIRATFQTFTSACAEPGGTEPIEHLIARADRDLQQEQERFDRETAHGVNARVQAQWKRRILALLN